ncbi:MAG: hypothetical protein CL930_00915 [Deltaproteobacteria bacterium]|nr:hypothetical protein [Deltaproteobacteria bacterium]
MDFGRSDVVRQLILLMAMSCAEPSWRHADLQLDITHANVQDTDRVRICIDGVRIEETTVGHGKLAFSQLPEQGPISIAVDHIVDEESVGAIEPVTLDEDTPWAEVPWVSCEGTCTPCTQQTSTPEKVGESQRFLAIHFVE